MNICGALNVTTTNTEGHIRRLLILTATLPSQPIGEEAVVHVRTIRDYTYNIRRIFTYTCVLFDLLLIHQINLTVLLSFVINKAT